MVCPEDLVPVMHAADVIRAFVSSALLVQVFNCGLIGTQQEDMELQKESHKCPDQHINTESDLDQCVFE